jgi:hypothetical protein
MSSITKSHGGWRRRPPAVLPRTVSKILPKVRTGDVRQKPLHRGAVDAVLLHPGEMARDGFGVVVREQKGRRAGGQLEGGRAAFVGIELGSVRPQVDCQGVRVLRIAAAAKPMAASDADGTIAGAVEPALVAGNVNAEQTVVKMGRPPPPPISTCQLPLAPAGQFEAGGGAPVACPP